MSTRIKMTTGVAIAIAVVIIAAALLIAYYEIQGTGKIKTLGVEVYDKADLTTTLGSIVWGVMGQGETKGVTVWIKVLGNVPARLTINASNWIPATIATYFTMTWNYSGAVLQPNQVVTVQIRLALAINIPVSYGGSDFSYTITIAAEEQP